MFFLINLSSCYAFFARMNEFLSPTAYLSLTFLRYHQPPILVVILRFSPHLQSIAIEKDNFIFHERRKYF
jgi:hypothetical protein